MEWLDIESAPKDGTEILAYQGGVFVASYCNYFNCWDEVGCDNAFKFPKPTHWMPLPPPPEEK